MNSFCSLTYYGVQAVLLLISYYLLSSITTSIAPPAVAVTKFTNKQRKVTSVCCLISGCLHNKIMLNNLIKTNLGKVYSWTRKIMSHSIIKQDLDSKESLLLCADDVTTEGTASYTIIMSYLLTHVVTAIFLIGLSVRSLAEFSTIHQVTTTFPHILNLRSKRMPIRIRFVCMKFWNEMETLLSSSHLRREIEFDWHLTSFIWSRWKIPHRLQCISKLWSKVSCEKLFYSIIVVCAVKHCS